MRLLHIFAGSAALALLAAATPQADAGTRFNFSKFPFIFDDGYDNDEFYYEDPPPRRRHALRRKFRQREEERYFSRDEIEPEQYGIYEPDLQDDVIDIPPRRRLDKVRKARESDEDPAPPKAPQKKKRAAIADPVAKPKPKPKPKMAAKPARPEADTALRETGSVLPEEKALSSGSAVSCAQATDIVSGYGFGEVKPTSCKGEVYAFRASRAGKTYEIKLAADSGELTEVAKQ